MTFTKKIALLVSMSLAALAFAIPASASAYTEWTVFGQGEGEGTEVYEGPFTWQIKSPYLDPGAFRCNAAITLEVVKPGESAGESRIVGFERDPSSCVGEGSYSNCPLKSMSDNLSSGWDVNLGSPLTVTNHSTGPIVIATKYDYVNSMCPRTQDEGRFGSGLEFVPTLDKYGQITEFKLNGFTESGIYYSFGPFKGDGNVGFGLK
jgi:hypothetical protein